MSLQVYGEKSDWFLLFLSAFLTFWPRLMVHHISIWFWTIWSWTIRTWWSWTIDNLKEYYKSSNAPGPYLKSTAPGAYSKHAPGAVRISNMILEYIWLRKFFQIMNGSYGPGPYVEAKITKKPFSWESDLHGNASEFYGEERKTGKGNLS